MALSAPQWTIIVVVALINSVPVATQTNCVGICFTNTPTVIGCFCSPLCSAFGNCCPDYFSTCVNVTHAPTTLNPTASPSTLQPTTSPTSLPSAIPTVFPTAIPSATPSVSPSAAPSREPTQSPIVTPHVAAPTSAPSDLAASTTSAGSEDGLPAAVLFGIAGAAALLLCCGIACLRSRDRKRRRIEEAADSVRNGQIEMAGLDNDKSDGTVGSMAMNPMALRTTEAATIAETIFAADYDASAKPSERLSTVSIDSEQFASRKVPELNVGTEADSSRYSIYAEGREDSQPAQPAAVEDVSEDEDQYIAIDAVPESLSGSELHSDDDGLSSEDPSRASTYDGFSDGQLPPGGSVRPASRASNYGGFSGDDDSDLSSSATDGDESEGTGEESGLPSSAPGAIDHGALASTSPFEGSGVGDDKDSRRLSALDVSVVFGEDAPTNRSSMASVDDALVLVPDEEDPVEHNTGRAPQSTVILETGPVPIVVSSSKKVSRKQTKRRKGKQNKVEIGSPTNFLHVATVNQDTVLGADFSAAGTLRGDGSASTEPGMATVDLTEAQVARGVSADVGRSPRKDRKHTRKNTKRRKDAIPERIQIGSPTEFVHVASVDQNTVLGADFTAAGELANVSPPTTPTMALVPISEAQERQSGSGSYTQTAESTVEDDFALGAQGAPESGRAQSTYDGFASETATAIPMRNSLTDPDDFDEDSESALPNSDGDDDDEVYGGFDEFTIGSGSDALVEQSRSRATMDLVAQPWYVGSMSRADCEAAVLAADTGDFLVRTRGEMQYVCINEGSKLVTLQVTGGPNSVCTCMGREFSSLIHVVEFLLRAPLVGKRGNLVHLAGAASTA
eukprot:m.462484 g.462484  ORF g.462484 m.462484 type:complete len:848 (+) comp22680_c0_seq1:207-2750(+)